MREAMLGAMLVAALAGALVPRPGVATAVVAPGPQDAPRSTAITMSDMVIPAPGTAPLKRPETARLRSVEPAVYDIHVFTMATPDGPVGLGSGQIAEMVAATDAWFAGATGGKYRFRLAGTQVEVPPYPDTVCGFEAAEEAVKPVLPLDKAPDATDAIWVVLTPEPAQSDCTRSGMGKIGAPGVWMSAQADLPGRVRVLTHEIGHNLGLMHSKAVVSKGTRPSWPVGSTPEIEEYGDTTDFMGIGGIWTCDWQCTWRQADISAHNLNLLGLLPEQAIASVPPGSSREVTLAPVDAYSGIRAVYLPWHDRAKFVLDFRPHDYLGGFVGRPEGPGSGVILRLVDSAPDDGPEPYTVGGGTAALSGEVSPPSGVIRIGMGQSEGHVLPDGTTVRVTSMSAVEARVLITRPPDTAPPTITAEFLQDCANRSCRLPGSAALWDNGVGLYDLPFGISDDFWHASASMVARGASGTVTVSVPERQPGVRSRTALRPILRLPAGRFDVSLTVTDLAGNQATQAWDVLLSPPIPATTWYRYNSVLSYSWPDWSKLRCIARGENCVGLAVKAIGACARGVQAVLESYRADGSLIESSAARVGPLRSKQMTMMVTTFTGSIAEVDHYDVRSLACSRRSP